MKKISILCLVIISYASLFSQTVTGKIVDQNGNGLPGLNLKLYVSPNMYETSSSGDGPFIFNNVTSVKEGNELPTGYSVSDNYPNPFNPKTRIAFNLANSGNVNIRVFNILGESVIEEIEKYFNAGTNFIDLELNGLPNGVYLARITFDNQYSVTKKLMLMYGSQHLSTSSGIASFGLNKSTLNKSMVYSAIDSLVATSKIIGKKIFSNLPNYNDISLNLGNLTIERYCLGTPTVNYAGKTYNTVQIGTQCWLKENLDVGTSINGNTNQTNNSTIEKYCYNNDENNCNTYGGLYQWNEAMAYSTTPGTKGICPDGWHIPTQAEFETLKAAVSNNSNELKAIGQGTGSGAGTNTSGFSALLAGSRIGDGFFDGLGIWTIFWSSTEGNSTVADDMYLYTDGSDFYLYDAFKKSGFSVRCVKD